MIRRQSLAISICVLLLSAGCAAPTVSVPPFSQEQLDETRSKSLSQVEAARSTGYLNQMAMLLMREQIPGRGNCTSAGGTVDMYLTIEADGTVSNVIGDPWNSRSECYARALTGIQVLRPPVSPFFFNLQLQ